VLHGSCWYFILAFPTRKIYGQFANSVSEQETLERLVVANGYKLSVLSDKLPGIRAIATTKTGDLIVSQPNEGNITLVFKDADNDGQSDGELLLAEGLNRPHGLAIHDGWLYIAETDAIVRVQYDAEKRKFLGTPHIIIKDSFPGGGNHWSRTVKVSPDNKLFVSVGSSCNACIESSAKRASILRYDLNGKNEVIYAAGLRNTVGFDWQPGTDLLFSVDNGRDLLGDDIPPEELNQINQGAHYGWPYSYGENVEDSDYADRVPEHLVMSRHVHQFTAHSTR